MVDKVDLCFCIFLINNPITEVRKHIIQNFVSRLCFFVSIFLVNLVLSRLLGAPDSGELYYAVNNYSIIALLASLSLESGMTYFSSKNELSKEELSTISFSWALLAGVIACLILVFFPGSFSLISGNKYVYSFFFISGTLLTTYFSGLFFAQRQFSYPHLIPAIINGAVVILCGWLLLAGRQEDRSAAIPIYFASFMLGGVLLGTVYCKKYSVQLLSRFPAKDTLRKLFQYSSVALLANVVSFLAYRVDYWVLKAFSPQVVSDGALGNYIQVAKLVQLFLFAPTIVATIVFPISASKTDSNFESIFKKTVLRTLALNATACAVLVLTGRWVFTFMYGPSFDLMYACFLFSIPAILFISVTRILASYLAGTNRIKFNLIGGLIALITIATLNFVLIPKMGINGAALADSAGYMLYMIFLLSFFSFKNRNVV